MKTTLRIKSIVLTMLIFLASNLIAQNRFASIENELKALVTDMPGLEDNVELSVNGSSIEEFIRGIAVTNKINISVDPSLDAKIVNNFSGVTVSDILLFLAKEHDLEITFTGSIISISKYTPPPKKEKVIPPKIPTVNYKSIGELINLDLKNDNLDEVARTITTKTGKNVVLAAGLEDKTVSCFIKEMPFDNALEKFAFANQLEVEKTKDNFYLLRSTEVVEKTASNKNVRNNGRRGKVANETNSNEIEVVATSMNNIAIKAIDVPIVNIIKKVSDELDVSYYLNSGLTGNTSLSINRTTYTDLLDHLMNATSYTYEKENGIYIIGERKIEKLRTTQVVQLQHRSLEHIVENIPAELLEGVKVKEFPDLNSLILSGSKPNIEEINSFIRKIDKVVPVVLIEVMLVDYTSERTVSAGVQVGIGDEPASPSAGSIFPDLNYQFNSESVNNLIENFNGNGFLNLGKVTPNFYASINALETNGVLRVRSTPKLATLNGSEASLTIGTTAFYAVESSNFVGSQIPTAVVTTQYESVNADLSVTIKPFVSGDDQITLDIKVEQSDFTARIPPEAPPGSVSRSFNSLLRIRNGEMILLGGLEQKSVSNSGRGVPLLSRIPIIKWLFSSRTKEKSKSKLNIFIKPTVLY